VFDLIFINNIFELRFSMTFLDLHFLQFLNISTKMICPFQICQQRFPDHISSFCQAEPSSMHQTSNIKNRKLHPNKTTSNEAID